MDAAIGGFVNQDCPRVFVYSKVIQNGDYSYSFEYINKTCAATPTDDLGFSILLNDFLASLLNSSSISKILLRNICSDQVAKRIPGSCSHEPIYKGAKCGTKWFEVSLVNQSDCIDGGIYNVDSCLNDFKSIVIA
jgi:hypothetical protein